MSVIPTDIRYAVRRWVARPGLAITVVLTLGLGIGATTAIFSTVYSLMLKPLPYQEPERIVELYTSAQPHQNARTTTMPALQVVSDDTD